MAERPPPFQVNAIGVDQTAPLEFVVTLGFSDRSTMRVILTAPMAALLVSEIHRALPEDE